MDPPRDQQTATRDNDDDDNINRLDTITTAEQGFAFLDTFDQLQEWSVADVDPLQKSNIPRIAPPNDAAPRSKVILIHDYAGGYNAYESSQGGATREERFACEHLQHVETFVYFSHHLVSVPPPTWTNTCHRSGVRVLGTFIVEPGSRQVERILERDENGSFWVARKLAEMAACYGFDGWLVNIEQPFPLWSWNADRLEGFLRQLRRELGGGKQVVW
jgi:endo-beta-N-acetylglucosaminidase D